MGTAIGLRRRRVGEVGLAHHAARRERAAHREHERAGGEPDDSVPGLASAAERDPDGGVDEREECSLISTSRC
jgi:hypothetical protein